MLAVKLLRHGHREWVVICFRGVAPGPRRRDASLSTSVLGEVCIHHVDHAPYSQKPGRFVSGGLVVPLLVLDLALLSGLPWIDLLVLFVVVGAMVLTLLCHVLLKSHGYVVICTSTGAQPFVCTAATGGAGSHSAACSCSTYSTSCS